MCLTAREIQEDYYKDLPIEPEINRIRTPADILAEEAAKLLAEQEGLRRKCNQKLPRKLWDTSKIYIGGEPKTVYEPIVTELKYAGWVVYFSYNNLCIEFPKGA